MFEDKPEDNRRHCTDHQKRYQMTPLCYLLAVPDQRPQQAPPFPPEIGEQRGSGADVQYDQERKKLWRRLIEMPAQHRRQDDRVTEAADRKQLSDTLDNGK